MQANRINKMKKEKNYVFIFEDRNGNELTRRELECASLAKAKDIAKDYKSKSMLNDLHKIVVKGNNAPLRAAY